MMPGPVQPSRELWFASRDGMPLYGELFVAPDSRATALIVHGFGEHCGRYREVAHVVARAGVTALSFDLRGHGRSSGQRGHCDRFDDYLDDVDAASAALDDAANEQLGGNTDRRFWIAHSHGSLIALRMLSDLERRPKRLLGAVVSSPFLGVRARVTPAKRLLAQAMSRALPTLTFGVPLRIDLLTHDAEKLAERQLDTLCHVVGSARWYVEMIETQRRVHDTANRVAVPTLWLVAGDDLVVDAEASRRVHQRLRSPSVYREYPDMHHEVFNECERGTVFAAVTDFIDAHLAAP